MIKPYGAEQLNPLYVEDDKGRAELTLQAEGLPSLLIGHHRTNLERRKTRRLVYEIVEIVPPQPTK